MADTNNTHDAIEAFDLLLEPYGLEIVSYEGTSDYIFKIAKRAS
jgi:hypothetical protein